MVLIEFRLRPTYWYITRVIQLVHRNIKYNIISQVRLEIYLAQLLHNRNITH